MDSKLNHYIINKCKQYTIFKKLINPKLSMKKVTIKDIAKLAGVSAPVVSVALSPRGNNTTNVSKKTREHIKKIAAELNYKPSILGRGLKNNKSYLVGIMVNDHNTAILGHYLLGLQKQLSSAGYAPIFLNHTTKEEQRSHLEYLLNRGVDALVINSWIDEYNNINDSDYLANKLPQDLPVLEVLGQYAPTLTSLSIDYYQSYKDLILSITNQGFRKISLILHEHYRKGKNNGPFYNSWEAYQAYSEAIEDNHLDKHIITIPLHSSEDIHSWPLEVYKRIIMLSEKNHVPEVIICTDDNQAQGVIRAFSELNIIPSKDIHIISFHSNPFYQNWQSRELPCLTPPFYQVGERTAVNILNMINGKKVPNEKILLDSKNMHFSS